MMSKEEYVALVKLLSYIDNDGWRYKDSDELTQTLTDYINGLVSTGVEPK